MKLNQIPLNKDEEAAIRQLRTSYAGELLLRLINQVQEKKTAEMRNATPDTFQIIQGESRAYEDVSTFLTKK